MKTVRQVLLSTILVAGVLLCLSTGAFAASPVQPEFPVFVGQGGAMNPDIDGNWVVWNKYSDDEIWCRDLDAGTTTKFLDATGLWQCWHPAVSGSTVVWQDNEGQNAIWRIWSGTLPGGARTEVLPEDNSSRRNQQHPAISWPNVVWYDAYPDANHNDIRGKNLLSGSAFWVTSDTDAQEDVAICGDKVVWSEYAWDGGERSIRGYDLTTQTEFPICTVAGAQKNPDISGDIVVWEDERASNTDIYGYDLATSTEFPICTRTGPQSSPKVSGGIVVFVDQSADPVEVRGYDIETGTEFLIATKAESPDVSNDTVVWIDQRVLGSDLYGARIKLWDASVVVDAGAAATGDRDVDLALTASRWSETVTEMRFSNDGSTWSDWEPFGATKAWTISAGDETKTVSAQFKSAAGGLSGVVHDDILLDTAAPETGNDADGLWHRTDVPVHLSPSDGGSGVDHTHFTVDSGSEMTGTSLVVLAPSNHSNDGIHTVTFWSEDKAGNVEGSKFCQVKIDTTPPSTSDDAGNAWHNHDVLVTLSPTDGGSDWKSTSYCLDSGTWENGTSLNVSAPSDHSNDGSHTLLYRSTDNAGNEEATVTTHVRIDTTPPSGITGLASTTHPVEANWYSNADPRFGWDAATDAPSGIAGYSIVVDHASGTTPDLVTDAVDTTYTAHGLADGVWYCHVRAIDLAGNGGPTVERVVRVDTTRPTTKAPFPSRVARGRKATLRYRVNDNLSPQATVVIRIKTLRGRTVKALRLGQRNTNALLSTRFRCRLRKGTYRFYVYANDLAGNSQRILGCNRLVVN